MAEASQINSSGLECYRNTFATVSFTPAATSHTGLDSVGGAVNMTLPHAAGRYIRPTGYRFQVATTTPITTVWTAFFYNAAIGTPIADDSPFLPVLADQAKFLGVVNIAQLVDYTSTYLESQGALSQPYMLVPATGLLNVYLQLTTTATLEAIAHTLMLFYEVQP